MDLPLLEILLKVIRTGVILLNSAIHGTGDVILSTLVPSYLRLSCEHPMSRVTDVTLELVFLFFDCGI